MTEPSERPLIMIVSESEEETSFLMLSLTHKKYKVMVFYSGKKALRFFSSSLALPDLILLDVDSDGINGFNILKKLKEDQRTKKIPVILSFSSYHRIEDYHKGLDLGADDYITKPISIELLFERLKIHLREKNRDEKSTNPSKTVNAQFMRTTFKPLLPPFSLKRFILHNIKCFKHEELVIYQYKNTPSWTLLVGDNGVGKSTILNCIALCALGPELASKVIPIPQNMLRNGEVEGYMEAVFEAPKNNSDSDASLEDKSSDISIKLVIRKGSRTFDVDMKENSPYAEQVKYFIDARKRTDREDWFIAGYGPVRNLIFSDKPSKLSQQDPVIDRVESLFNPSKVLIDPGSLYRFLSGDTSPFEEMGAPRFLQPETISHLQILLGQLLPKISFDDLDENGRLGTEFGNVPISELSEGYKSMLSWLTHLIMHLMAAVNWEGDINEIKGIVLIDEVDLHLHPSWQQKVISHLRESFPNLQFIGSTHSPMTAGGANEGEIILLEQQNGEVKINQDLPSIKGWRADQILTGPLFGLESTRDLKTQNEMDEYTGLLELSEPSQEEIERLGELEQKLEEKIPTTGETELEREAFQLIEKTMDAYLNSQPPEKREKLLKEIKRQLKI